MRIHYISKIISVSFFKLIGENIKTSTFVFREKKDQRIQEAYQKLHLFHRETAELGRKWRIK